MGGEAYHHEGMGQPIQFCASADGTRIAYQSSGTGPPLVRTAYYLSSLELDWEYPPWKPYLEEFSGHYTLVRHDTRGFGLSDRDVAEQSLDLWVRDLEAVVDAAGLERFALTGMCHGGPVAIEYAARHPERVTRMLLYGTYARGRAKRESYQLDLHEMSLRHIERGWGNENESFNRVWSLMFQPSSTAERRHALSEMQRKASSGATAARTMRAAGEVDVRKSAAKVRCPTLVLHTTRNPALPFDEGRLLASLIPDARLVALESDNHLLTEVEPAWPELVREVHGFLAPEGVTRGNVATAYGLTARELDVLEHVAAGLDNSQIAAHLGMSEKTVRNHVTRIFDKLGAENRPQVIVRAREAGLGVKLGAGRAGA